jgi:hypothetical protein
MARFCSVEIQLKILALTEFVVIKETTELQIKEVFWIIDLSG